MRCPECNRFVGYDDTTSPEINDLEVDGEGHISGSIRIVLVCAEDGSTELKEANFDVDVQVPDAWLDTHQHPTEENPEVLTSDLSIEDDGDFELTSRQDNPNSPARYRRTYYGYSGSVTVTCNICEEGHLEDNSISISLEDEVPASGMEELTQ